MYIFIVIYGYDFFCCCRNYVLQMSDGIDDLGSISWQLTLCLLAAWIVTILCLIKGIKSTGKV